MGRSVSFDKKQQRNSKAVSYRGAVFREMISELSMRLVAVNIQSKWLPAR